MLIKEIVTNLIAIILIRVMDKGYGTPSQMFFILWFSDFHGLLLKELYELWNPKCPSSLLSEKLQNNILTFLPPPFFSFSTPKLVFLLHGLLATALCTVGRMALGKSHDPFGPPVFLSEKGVGWMDDS